MALTEKQKRFVDFYVQTANATEAARRAGYSHKTAYVIGGENMHKPEIRKAIERRLKKLESKRIAGTEEVLEHLTAVIRGEVKETLITQHGKKIVVPVRESDKIRACEHILKVNGAFREKLDVEVSGADLFRETLERVWANQGENNASENLSEADR